MDSDEELTQPTQKALDPRRLGKQNTGFSDEDVADIVCLLLPRTEAARHHLRQISLESSQHIIRRDDAERVEWDYEAEDDAKRFTSIPADMGEHAIVLRLSSDVKNSLDGWNFGRNRNRCDICFPEDPHRRLSNVHFRIYINEYGVLMLEDSSTNGTIVDDHLLKAKSKNPSDIKRTLTSGSTIKILMHQEDLDLEFLVRIPRREGEYEEAYRKNLTRYTQMIKNQRNEAEATIVPGPQGHVDLFPLGRQNNHARRPAALADSLDEITQEAPATIGGIPRTWSGSEQYNRVGEIGRGAFATVYKVTSKFDGRPYAAKELDKRKFMKNGVLDQKVENEMNIMQRVHHPNIVRYIQHLDWDDRLFIIIMEYVPGGDLGKLINDYGRLSEDATKTLARQLLDALNYLHESNITHRDVKPDNILIESQQPFVVKLTDFGLSKMVDNNETFLRTFCGTLLYCAPEVYSEYVEYDEFGHRNPRNRQRRQGTGQRYDHAVDIWSLGGVLFYALTGSPPFPVKAGTSYSELLHQVMTKPLDISPLQRMEISADGIDFVWQMLNRRPEDRATIEGLFQHPWMGGSGQRELYQPPNSQDLEKLSLDDKENQPALAAAADLLLPPDSDDEIVDEILDEGKENNESHLDMSIYESGKENYTFGPSRYPREHQRLFGEVDASAIGSSGVVPAGRINLEFSEKSLGKTEIIDGYEVRDSFESNASSTPRQKKSQDNPSDELRISVLSSEQSRSDQVTPDSACESLRGGNSTLKHLDVKSTGGSHSHPRGDHNKSKRKTTYEITDELSSSSSHGRPNMKRFRSEGPDGSNTDCSSDDSEYELYEQIPSISRASSDRQIDNPVHKAAYWSANDKTSWHLNYPEMTQLQLDAFQIAADARGEKFGPRSSLWNLALRYFPADHHREATSRRASNTLDDDDFSASLLMPTTADQNHANGPFPPDRANGVENRQGAGKDEHDSLPDTQIQADVGLVVPVNSEPGKRVIASFHSLEESAVKDITVLISESMVSWGRAPGNTREYRVKNEVKVPKHAFKVLLWKDRFDPCKTLRPWVGGSTLDESSFHFYISTKASQGICVNRVGLPSNDCKNPASPSKYWVRLYDGDLIDVWMYNHADENLPKTRLVFRCTWGGSAEPRLASASPVNFVPEPIARKLDEASSRVEKKMPDLLEHDRKMEEATADANQRKLYKLEQERERSHLFEQRILEVNRKLAQRGGGGPSSLSSARRTPGVSTRLKAYT